MKQSGYQRMFHALRLSFDIDRFDERAGIQQYDGGLDLHDAEYEAALVQWIEAGRNPNDMPYLGA